MHSSSLPHALEIRAAVTERDGEISCSIEETNRIRALLGMKPLAINDKESLNPEQEAVLNLKRKEEAERKTHDTADLMERIERAQNRRLLNSKLEGKALGELEGGEEASMLNAAEWVKRSRLKHASDQERAKEAAMLAAKRLEREEEERLRSYRAAELKGLKVMHGADNFEAGEEVILTLADSHILRRGEHGQVLGVLEDGDDVLMNPLMMDEEKRAQRERQAKRAKQPVYSGYDDAEFVEGMAPGAKPSILSHYDKEQNLGPKLVLGEGGTAFDELEPAKRSVLQEQDLRMDISISNDFYTPKEYASFHKPKKLKKSKKIRRHDSADDDIIASLEAAAKEGIQDSHLGKRGAGSVGGGEIQETERRRQAYEEAAKAAGEKLAKAVLGSKKNDALDDDDAEIVQSLNRVRRLALKEKFKDSSELDPGARVLQELKQHEPLTKFDRPTESEDFDEIDAEGRRKNGTLVFTSTTEFSTRLGARLSEVARSRAEEVVRDQEQRDLELVIDESVDNTSDMELSEMMGSEAAAEEELDFVHKQPITAKGMAAALALIRESGDLKSKTELAGRAKDDRAYDPSADDLGVKIEYRDEFGRKLTQKEAFRQLSYRFHGQGPSKKKLEKRLREMQSKSNEVFSKGATETGTMKSLMKAQEATGKAFVTIQVFLHSFHKFS